MVENDCVFKVLLLTLVFCLTYGFNLSPIPNHKFNVSSTNNRSSYFGFTINLRKSSVIVSAPRAQSTLLLQLTIKEPGVVYKCTIANNSCTYLIFDYTSNKLSDSDNFSFSKAQKDYQWLGASMDGSFQDAEKLVVCAPKLMDESEHDNLMHGICYWMPNTLNSSSLDVQKIAPLRLIDNQLILKNNQKFQYHENGEQGLSVHITKNNEEIIIGAPGIYNWKGSVIRYLLDSEVNTHLVNRKTNKFQYKTDIPNPDLWNQNKDSYFGYSVGSGYFNSSLPNKIYYVASAPQANHQSGEAYIFDIIKTENGKNHSIEKLYTFCGSQFGEYFGYAVLAEDFNGDGLTDLIVTAPQYSSEKQVDQGAIYVFINKGISIMNKFDFEPSMIIASPLKGNGRFGTTISNLGDINQDGFNDIAVGAPFAGNGTVFIYLGSSKGLREVSSQQLIPGPLETSWGTSAMFGHGLSKGCDIDDNGFNDLAIGAPNAEYVFVYRSYPVVKIHATINLARREIKEVQKMLRFEICFRISSPSHKVQSQDITIRMNVDRKYNRVTLKKNKLAELIFNATAGLKEQCHMLDAIVEFKSAYIYKAIELEMHYDLVNRIPNSDQFCDKCAAVDPADPKVTVERVSFTTGCKSDICIADLKVTSSGISSTYVLGSSSTISVIYEVTNSGETAYLPRINITSSNRMQVNKIPTSCDQNIDFILCDLNPGMPMPTNSKEIITIIYDVSQIIGPSIIHLNASVFCTGGELNSSDNDISDLITLSEFTEIEVIDKTTAENIDLEKVFDSSEIINKYEIKSNGPSTIQEIEIGIDIPIAYKFEGSTQLVTVIDSHNISAELFYNNQLFYAELYQNNTLLVSNSTENISRTTNTRNGNETMFQPSHISHSVETEKNSDEHSATTKSRRRRHSTEEEKEELWDFLNNYFWDSSKVNRSFVFNCNDAMVTCMRAVMKVNKFIPNRPVTIRLKYNIDLNAVNKILTEPLEFFEISPKLEIVKIGDPNGITTKLTITKTQNHKIFKNHVYNNNKIWWMISLAIFGGILVLTAITYGMHKAGFFKRNSIEEIQRLAQEKQDATEWREQIMMSLSQKNHEGENVED